MALDESAAIETNEKMRHLSQRSLTLAISCLAITALVLVFALVLGLAVASSAQKDNQDLRNELSCRADITTDYALAQSDVALASAELTSTIGLGLAAVAEDADLTNLVPDLQSQAANLEAAAQALRQAGEDRQAAMDACEVG